MAVAGGYPFSAVVVAAWLHGMSGALAAAVVLAGAAIARVPMGRSLVPDAVGGAEAVPADLLSTALLYLLAAAVLAWGMAVLRRTAEERDAAEAALLAERAGRVLADERSATAAHLHDSVLQTLALIQRRSGDAAEVVGLARAQERALREWLAGRGRADPGGSFAAALDDAAAEVETLHRVAVEVVHVGDAPLDARLEAVAGATREALVNAAKHADVDQVQVYAEVAGGGATIYVRDRGRGFDVAEVPPDRRGLAHSVVGRMQAVGGAAMVRSRPGEGTEVELSLPPVRAAPVG